MSNEREPQDPVKIVLKSIETKELSKGFNATIVGTGEMTKDKEKFTRWFQTKSEADKALQVLEGKNGYVVSIDKWHIKEGYKNWEDYSLLQDEEPPAPRTEQEKLDDSRSDIQDFEGVAKECMASAKKIFEETYPEITEDQDGLIIAKALEVQQKWGISLFIKVTG